MFTVQIFYMLRHETTIFIQLLCIIYIAIKMFCIWEVYNFIFFIEIWSAAQLDCLLNIRSTEEFFVNKNLLFHFVGMCLYSECGKRSLSRNFLHPVRLFSSTNWMVVVICNRLLILFVCDSESRSISTLDWFQVGGPRDPARWRRVK